jgi:PilZ domain
MEEKRKSQRRRVLKTGKIVFNGGRSLIDCTVRNISDTGALLRVTSPVGIPEQFVLYIEADGFQRTAKVVRRTSHGVAVNFKRRAPAASSRTASLA